MLFSAGEKVLCFHVGLLYEAKVLKAEKWTGDDNLNKDVGPHYLVHYQGWRARWDEWVPESRMLKLNEDNLGKQKALIESVKAAQEAKNKEVASRKSGGRDTSEMTDGGDRRKVKESRGTKRARDTVEQEDEYIKRPEIKISINDALKVKLVDDWENVTKKSQLVPLPRKPSIDDFLREYKRSFSSVKRDSKASSLSRPPAVLDEVLEGLKLYFNKALGNNLLYRFERAQYVQAGKEWENDKANEGKEMEPSKVYGAEHLLRLFVNLPSIVAHTTMDADSIQLLKEHLAELLAFLVREQKRLFVREYETPGTSYHRLSST